MFDSPLSASAYEVLQIDADASHEDLRKAYRLRLRQTHPDTGGDAVVFVQVQRSGKAPPGVRTAARLRRPPQ